MPFDTFLISPSAKLMSGANPLKFNFRAMVVTVCSMEKSSEYPLLKIPVKKLGLGHDISFANCDNKLATS